MVSGVLDQNQNLLQDPREAYGSARVPRGRPEVGELWAFAHDTVPPRIQNATADDSVSATVTFSQKLDPRQRLTPRDVRLRLLPDSTPVAVASILPKPVDDSLNRRTPAADTTKADTAKGDSLPPRRPPGRAPPAQPETGPALTSRPPLFDRLVVRVPRPWAPGARLVLEVRGLRNVSGAAGTAVGVIAVPERPKPTARDTSRAAGRRDTTPARPPARKPAAPPRQ